MAPLTHVVYVGALTAVAPGGATIRNRLMVEELKNQGTAVVTIDTGGSGRAARFSQLRRLLAGIARHEQLILSVSRNGAYTLIVIMALASLLRPRLRHVLLAVGSSLPDNVRRLQGPRRRFYVWCLSRCHRIFVQATWIKRELEQLGVPGVEIMPNPRPAPVARWSVDALAAGRVAFVARVTPEKGPEQAMAAVEELRAAGLNIHLDVYGPIAPDYEERFRRLLTEFPGTSYAGVLSAAEVPEALAWHAAFILPTTWATEGMPGALVEAGMVGMPVVVSDSEGIAEFVRHGESGLLVDPTDVGALAVALESVLTDPQLAQRLGACLLDKLRPFEAERVVEKLGSDLRAEGWR